MNALWPCKSNTLDTSYLKEQNSSTVDKIRDSIIHHSHQTDQ